MTRTPTATYRLQLDAAFTLHQAATLVPYLHRLGVSDLYASPILQARRGSTHGYDVTDPSRIDTARGGEDGIAALARALDEVDMGLLVDIVPNHMAANTENPWWHDVLRHGPASRYAHHFDIDWASSDARTEGRLLLPVLDADPDRLCREGHIRLARDGDALVIDAAGPLLPLDPCSLTKFLKTVREPFGQDAGPWDLLDTAIHTADEMPPPTEPGAMETRARGSAVFDQALCAALADVRVRQRIDAALKEHEATATAELLTRQSFVLADWREAPHRVNYRRFFDINDLVSVRTEDPAVFHDLHRRIVALAMGRVVTGLRIDHVDGLADPRGYLERLQETLRAALATQPAHKAHPAAVTAGDHATRSDASTVSDADPALPFYVVVEKILVGPEELPQDWPVHGATGYEAAARIEGLFADTAGLARLEEVYSGFIGERRDYAEVVHEAKRQVIAELFPGLFVDLARRLDALAGGEGPGEGSLRQALEAAAAAFPVYRTYCAPSGCSPRDHQTARDAIQTALRWNPHLQEPLALVEAVLLHRLEGVDPAAQFDWVRRWQQTTGPVMAKGYEDTALYRYFSLVSLNEVGDRPDRPVWLEDFHATMKERARRMPYGLNAGTTHDSKRSEDVRARLNVLSERPDDWADRIAAWHDMNAHKKTALDGVPRPGNDMEYLLYETLVGAWPLAPDAHADFPDRIAAYMVKAAREAKKATHWLHPDADYEAALTAFARDLAAAPQEDPFRRSLEAFVQEIAPNGMVNSLAQTVLRCTIPGVPDTYQGQELWDLSLVDPDNRRPVDFARRLEVLDALDHEAAGTDKERTAFLQTLVEAWPDGRIKAYILSRALRLRRARPALFARGEYIPLQTQGRWARHVVAFARHLDGAWALVVTPRSTHGVAGAALPLGDVWGDTRVRLPAGTPPTWYDRFTDAARAVDGDDPPALAVRDLLSVLPVALLTETPEMGRSGSAATDRPA